ncbi:MAG: plasmid replication, integration and excision activator [Dermatophilus congolensis]|nr:plasmid replication, integration and excision activator [Dermatophilus congolensis]
MAMQKRFAVEFGSVFPAGAFLVGAVESVADFNAPAREDGSRPQQLDKETGLPVWAVQVLDADPEAGKRDKTVTVKLLASHQPVPPSNETPFPFTPVEFVGLTALPWIDDNGAGRARIAWSFRAEGLTAPGSASVKTADSVKAGA